MEHVIVTMSPADWDQVRLIYLEGIKTGLATLEREAPDWEKWNASHLEQCRLVAKVDETVTGWAALGPVSTRRVYSGVAEVSVYVSENCRGRGIGHILLEALIACSEVYGIWTLQAGILADNVSSRALHERCGFREVGRRERIGRLGGVWRDVVLLERRSKVVGVE
jgi:L-amino acid N-acyltransferase YncA